MENQPKPSEVSKITTLTSFILGNNSALPVEYAERLSGVLIKEAGRVGVDVATLASVAAVESHFWPALTSSRGAKGVTQVMPFWTKEEKICNIPEQLLYDPESNIRCGAVILHKYIAESGSLEKGLAYYNAGPKGSSLDVAKAYAIKVLLLRNKLCSVEKSLCEVKV